MSRLRYHQLVNILSSLMQNNQKRSHDKSINNKEIVCFCRHWRSGNDGSRRGSNKQRRKLFL